MITPVYHENFLFEAVQPSILLKNLDFLNKLLLDSPEDFLELLFYTFVWLQTKYRIILCMCIHVMMYIDTFLFMFACNFGKAEKVAESL